MKEKQVKIEEDRRMWRLKTVCVYASVFPHIIHVFSFLQILYDVGRLASRLATGCLPAMLLIKPSSVLPIKPSFTVVSSCSVHYNDNMVENEDIVWHSC